MGSSARTERHEPYIHLECFFFFPNTMPCRRSGAVPSKWSSLSPGPTPCYLLVSTPMSRKGMWPKLFSTHSKSNTTKFLRLEKTFSNLLSHLPKVSYTQIQLPIHRRPTHRGGNEARKSASIGKLYSFSVSRRCFFLSCFTTSIRLSTF